MFKRLQKLCLCASHQTTLDTVDALGMNFDAKVKQWKVEMVENTCPSSHIQVCKMLCNYDCISCKFVFKFTIEH